MRFAAGWAHYAYIAAEIMFMAKPPLTHMEAPTFTSTFLQPHPDLALTQAAACLNLNATSHIAELHLSIDKHVNTIPQDQWALMSGPAGLSHDLGGMIGRW